MGAPNPFHAGEARHSLPAEKAIADGQTKLAEEASEMPLRKKLAADERKFQRHNSPGNLQRVEKDRYQLADRLMSHGKISEAEKLFQDCTRDEEAKDGTLDNAAAERLLNQWVRLELKNDKVAQVNRSLDGRMFQVVDEVDRLGVPPESWLVKAMSGNRVLAIGEDHSFVGKNDHREFLGSVVDELKTAGATHMAVEFPSKYQQMLDRFLATGDWEDIPANRSTGNNIDLAVIANFQSRKDLQDVLTAAHQAGLNVVAVDSADALNRGRRSATFGSERDKYIAGRISQILTDDPRTKVIYWGGALHAAGDAGEVWHDTAGEILRKNGFSVASVTSIIPDMETTHDATPLYPMTYHVRKPVAVPTSEAKALREIPASNDCFPGNVKLNAWDAVIIYPKP